MDLQAVTNAAMAGTPNFPQLIPFIAACLEEGITADAVERILGRMLVAGGVPPATLAAWAGAIAHVIGNVVAGAAAPTATPTPVPNA